jgi:hypothetical protein
MSFCHHLRPNQHIELVRSPRFHHLSKKAFLAYAIPIESRHPDFRQKMQQRFFDLLSADPAAS